MRHLSASHGFCGPTATSVLIFFACFRWVELVNFWNIFWSCVVIVNLFCTMDWTLRSRTCIHLIYTTLVNLASFLAIFSLHTIPHQTYKTNHRKLVNYWPIKCLSQSTNSSLALGFHKLSLAMSRSPFLLFTLKSRCNGETYQHCAYIIRLRSRSCVKNNTKAI